MINESAISTTETAVALPFWRQIRWTLVVTYVLLAVLPMLLVTAFIINSTYNQIEQSTYNQLEGVAQVKKNNISTWLEQTQSSLEQFTVGRPNLYPTLQSENGVQSISDLLAQTDIAQPLFNGVFIYDTDGTILASSESAQIGRTVANQPYFAGSLVGNNDEEGNVDYIQAPYYDLRTGELTMLVTHGLHDPNTGELFAIVATEPNLDTLGNIMLERTGLGETGDAYLVSPESNFLLTPSRFEDDGYIQTRAYRSEGIDNALQGIDGSGQYNNYQDPPETVYGAYRWLPDLQVGMLVELAEADAQATTTTIRGISTVVAAIIGVLAGFIGFLIAGRIANPIMSLTQTASEVAGGDVSQQVAIHRRNEIGLLADAFNRMTTQLRDLISSLEDRVAQRTHRLEIIATLGEEFNTIYDLDTLLAKAVTQIGDKFNYYHTHIYMLDESGKKLVVQAGLGEAGRQLKAEKYAIALDTPSSLVARVARTKQVVQVDNVREDPAWLPNPLLPDTYSEMAVPIMAGGNVVGVLDVQENKIGGLDEGDAGLMRSLANQIGTAVANIQLINNIQARAHEMEVVASVSSEVISILDSQDTLQNVVNLTKDGFGLYHAHIYLLDPEDEILKLTAGAGTVGQTLVEQKHQIPLDREQSLVARAARTRQTVFVNDVTQDPGFLPNPLLPATQAELASPIIIEDRVLGVLDVQDVRPFDETTILTMNTLTDQIGAVLQNSALYEEIQEALADARLFRQLVDASSQGIGIASLQGEIYYINSALSEYIGRTGADNIKDRQENMMDFYPPKLHDKLQNEVLPTMIQQGEWIGELELLKPDGTARPTLENFFPIRNEDGSIRFLADIITDITAQRETAEQVAQALSLAEDQAQRLSALNEMSADFNLANTMSDVYQVASRHILHIVYGDRASIALLSEGGQSFDVLALDGVKGAIPMGSNLPVMGTAVGLAIREKRTLYLPKDGQMNAYMDSKRLADAGINSTISMPLVASGQTLGAINLASRKKDAFTNVDINFLRQMVNLVAATIESYQLGERSRLLADIVEHHPDFIGIGELDGRVTYINPAGLHLLGLPENYNVRQMQLIDMYDEDSVAKLAEEAVPTLREEGVWSGNLYLRQADGSMLPIEETAFVNYDAAGSVEGYSFTLRDITDRYESEAAQKQLASEMQEQLYQINKLQQTMTQEGWEAFMTSERRAVKGYMASEQEIEAIMANTEPQWMNEVNSGSFAIPINLRGITVGKLGIQNTTGEALPPEAQELITAVTVQVAEALERTRLFEETELARATTQAQARREQLLREISNRINNAVDAESILKTAVQEIGRTLNLKTMVYLNDEAIENSER